MRIKYIIKYTKYARDYKGKGAFYLVDRRGFTRSRKWERLRVILKDQDIDYKDLVVVTEPQSIKGLSVLTWMYVDPERERDIWLWLPSQRKLRRVSPADADDAAFGSDWTTEEMSTRTWDDETYSYLNVNEIFPGCKARYTGKTYYEGKACWVVEARPKRDPWYYSRRVLHIPKDFGVQILDEVYDPNGKKFKEFLKVQQLVNQSCLTQGYLECFDLRIDHLTVNTFENVEINTGLDEKMLSPKTLMRTKW